MRLALVLMLFAATELAAASEWVRVTSANFELYSNAGEKDAQRTLEYFEQVREFFERTRSAGSANRLPVTVVAFRNRKDYKPYTIHESTTAYYVGDDSRDYIVLSGVGQEVFPFAVHEYIHLLVRHSGLKLPVWLNEGVAEVYSTLKPIGGEIVVGVPPAGRAISLAQETWLPVEKLLQVKQGSPEYSGERNRVGVFYAQSWMLTHMLMMSPKYRNQFNAFLTQVNASGDSVAALEKAYGFGAMQISKDLKAYYAGNQLLGARYPARFEKITGLRTEAAVDVELALASIQGLLGKHEEAQTRLSKLASEAPQSAQVEEALGHLYWRQNRREDAVTHFRKAVALKPESWKTYWDFARLAANQAPAVEIIAALERTVALNPNLMEAKMMLGFEQYRAQQYGSAFVTLLALKQVTPEQAASVSLAIAHSAIRLNKFDVAEANAAMAKKYAKHPDDQKSAEELATYLESRKSRRNSVLQPPLEARPEVVREDFQRVQGELEEVVCTDKLKLVMRSGEKKLALLVRTPESVMIKNSEAATVEMKCGPQNGARVRVEFVEIPMPPWGRRAMCTRWSFWARSNFGVLYSN